MTRFLQLVPVPDAVRAARQILPGRLAETVPPGQSAGRILAAPVRADGDIPGFDRSIVDGYALRAPDTAGAADAAPVLLHCTGRIAMGSTDSPPVLRVGECAYVPTGGPLPQGSDAAVMVEYTERASTTVLVKRPVFSGENILRRDEDFRSGELIFEEGRRLSPRDAGVLAACGCSRVPVVKKPVVGIISTGNELVPADARPGPGQVRDANAPMLAAWLAEYGCVPKCYGIVRDERESFDAAIEQAVPACDLILLSGGSSKDDRDLTAAVIASRGEVLVHGIAIAPGKPTIIGRIETRPVFGLPGHPASAFVVLLAVVRPCIDAMLGQNAPPLRTASAVLAENIPSPQGREEYIRVRLENGTAYPVIGKSGLLRTLVRSDGLVRIPATTEGIEKGSRIDVILW